MVLFFLTNVILDITLGIAYGLLKQPHMLCITVYVI